MSTYIDAAGSFGLQRLPHLAVQYKNQPERKDLFKISAIFKKVIFTDIDISSFIFLNQNISDSRTWGFG